MAAAALGKASCTAFGMLNWSGGLTYINALAQVVGPGDKVLGVPEQGTLRLSAGLTTHDGAVTSLKGGVLKSTRTGQLFLEGRQKRWGGRKAQGVDGPARVGVRGPLSWGARAQQLRSRGRTEGAAWTGYVAIGESHARDQFRRLCVVPVRRRYIPAEGDVVVGVISDKHSEVGPRVALGHQPASAATPHVFWLPSTTSPCHGAP